ncbi:MAG: pseudouridine synthase [Fusobacteriota bacterium]
MSKQKKQERINKFLANLGIAARRKIDDMIEDGRVKVNGKKAQLGQKVTPDDSIEIDGDNINTEKEIKNVYYLLNKPQKVLSATSDYTNRKLVVDFIKDDKRVYPVGRLDYDTEGIIILTNDGDIVNRILRPSAKVYKTYLAKVEGKLSYNDLKLLEEGIYLQDGLTLPAKAKVERRIKGNTWVEIKIREGRNRQVRRMFDQINHPVMFLRRTQIGKIKIGNLLPGEYRDLTKKELDYIYNLDEKRD